MKLKTIILSCLTIAAGLALSSCETAYASPYRTCPNGTLVRKNQACPQPLPGPTPPLIPDPVITLPPAPIIPPVVTPPPPTETLPVVSPTLAGATDVPDGINTSDWLEPGEAPHTSVDEVGAFRFTCLAGQLLRDDPIVYPGQPGASHLHQFFGNTGTNGNSTYASLRTTGGSTCTRSADASVQRTAYWMPAMLDGVGNAVKPDWVNTYYKRLPATDIECTHTVDPTNPSVPGPDIGVCVGIPNGIRFVTGYNMALHTGGPADTNSRDYWAMGYDCMTTDGTNVSYTGVKHTIKEIVDTGLCPVDAWLRVFVSFPQCWDGLYLDVVGHRSHISIPPQSRCPSDHPYKVPEVAVSSFFRTDANFEAGKWHLSSDEMVPGTIAGTTLHMDYWEAWNGTIKNIWQTHCIDGHLTCSSGNVGTSQQIKGMQQIGPVPNHVLVPLSSIP